jgi:hypothetical protein
MLHTAPTTATPNAYTTPHPSLLPLACREGQIIETDSTDSYPYHTCTPGASPYQLNYLFEAEDPYAKTICWQIAVPGCNSDAPCCDVLSANLHRMLMEIGERRLERVQRVLIAALLLSQSNTSRRCCLG